MNAIILSAGLGTRLRPLTDFTPKCLMPIGGVPILDIWIERLLGSGIASILVNKHHLAEKVEMHLKQSQNIKKIKLVHEAILLGTAGTLIENIDFYNGEDGFLLHADNYCNLDISGLIRAHKARPPSCLITMVVFKAKYPEECGIVEINAEDVVTGFFEKISQPPGNNANAAIYVLSKDFLKDISLKYRNAKDFVSEILPMYLGRIYAYKVTGDVIDIGTQRNLNEVIELENKKSKNE